jgi:hypothetical protein
MGKKTLRATWKCQRIMHFVFGNRAAAHISIKSASSPEAIPSDPVDLVNALIKYHKPTSAKINDPKYLRSSSIVMVINNLQKEKKLIVDIAWSKIVGRTAMI